MTAALIGLALVAAIAACVACFHFIRRWREEQAESARIRATFARYVPRWIVDELLERKDAKLFAGREMRATILVCRIWNFSQFIESLTPEQTLRYLNEFYAMAGSSIERQRGILHRFLEDGVVGVFGVPLEDHQQEDHALRAAINIVRLVALMQEKWLQQNRKALHVGVGINTGNVIAGDAGFAQRREYQVVGPDVALAHRLQGATVDLNAYIVASRTTVEPVQDLYNLVPVSGVPLAGRRALLDASIVRGRKRADPLILPKADAFATTVIDEHALEDVLEPLETVPFEAVTEPATVPVREAPPAPPPLKTRPRPRAEERSVERPNFDLPELRSGSLNVSDAEPALPDPPPPRATYEDNDGPPFAL